MAQHRTKEEWLDLALKAIEKHKLFFISDIAPMIGLSETRFYQIKLNEVEEIKEALLKNKIQVKSSMRSKWYQSDNPTLQVGLMKLIGTEEEYHRLANTKIDVTSREEVPIFQGINLEDDQQPSTSDRQDTPDGNN